MTNDIPKGGHLLILLPIEIIVVSSNLAFQAVETLNSASVLSYNSTTNALRFSNAFSAAYSAPTTVEFVITTGLINPNTDKQTGYFVISTLSPGNVTID